MTPAGVRTVLWVIRAVEVASVLAIVVSVLPRWLHTRARASGWVLAAFGSLGLILGMGFVHGPTGALSQQLWVKATLILLLLVPYLLVRFVAALGAVGRLGDATATTLIVAEVAATLVLPTLPATGARPGWLWGYLLLIVGGWTVQSVVASHALVRAGRGQPTVVHHRMSMLGAGTMILASALIASLFLPASNARSSTTVGRLVVPTVGLMGILLFLLSFVAPRVLRTLWRQPELAALSVAQVALLTVETPVEMAGILVPHLARLLGGDGAAILDTAGLPLAAQGMTEQELDAVAAVPAVAAGTGWTARPLGPDLAVLAIPRGWLAVRASRFSPVFGAGEQAVLVHLAYLADLSLQRLEILAAERAGAQAMEHLVGQLQASQEELERARDTALEGSRLKSEFLANMSHEIRTPMNGVIGMASLLLETHLDADQRDYAATVRSSAEALLTVIDDILDFSKIEAGRLEVELIDLDPVAVVEEAAQLLAGPAQAKDLELTCSLDPALPSLVRGDPGRLRQVLVNLLGNAVKFTEVGEVEISADLVEREVPAVEISATVVGTDVDRVEVEFRIRDTGIGMDPQSLDRLFTGFIQADSSTTRRFGGTGLGLSISRQLVGLMGGTLRVDSAVGQGSTFTVRLPFQRSPTAVTPGPDEQLRGRRVLIVDDNATNRRVLLTMLEAMGADAVGVDGAAAAMRALSAAHAGDRRFDAALLDLNMPHIDGLTLAEMIRADQALAMTPLLLLTSSAQRGRTDSSVTADINGYLTKPIRQRQLRFLLLSVLGRFAAATGGEQVAAHAGSAADAAAAVPAGADRPRGSGGRLLLAEDNLVNQKVALHTLARLGYDVMAVTDGEQALTALAKETFDAVLMDCQMPIRDGYSATRELRRREGRGRRTPVIAMTASAMAEDRDRCLAAGMDDFLPKPVRADHLDICVHRWINEVRAGTATAPTARKPVPSVAPAAPSTPPAPADTGLLSADGQGAVDEAALQDLRASVGGDKALMDSLVASYLEEAATDMRHLLAAARVEDRAAVRAVAHRLRSSSALLGAAGLAGLLLELERAAGPGDGDLAAAAGRVEAEYARVRSAFSESPADVGPSRGPRR